MLDGFVAVDIFEGICNKQRFVDFVLNQVVPVINPYSSNNSIIIMDNVKIHYDTDFISLLEASGLRFLDDGYGRNEFFDSWTITMGVMNLSVFDSWTMAMGVMNLPVFDSWMMAVNIINVLIGHF
ncbi:IS630 family transposase [Rhizophagus clarus]|uniref:IS630 family transposase n=1 Tax=Rhizophagus clarus TaxID=94130 RepID=A0A8H3L5X4_9GLOM|nr:IS630 family transposase [Rhizophagus clarus]